MKLLKQFFVLIVIALVGLALFACKEDDPPPEQPKNQSTTLIGLFETTEEYPNGYSTTITGYLTDTEWDGVATKIETALNNAFNAGNGIAKTRFRNVFGDGDVIITIENNTNYNGYKVGETYNDLRFSFEYLSTVSATDLQTAITTAVTEMFGKIAK